MKSDKKLIISYILMIEAFDNRNDFQKSATHEECYNCKIWGKRTNDMERFWVGTLKINMNSEYTLD